MPSNTNASVTATDPDYKTIPDQKGSGPPSAEEIAQRKAAKTARLQREAEEAIQRELEEKQRMAQETFDIAKSALEEILTLSKIERIIFVDDNNSALAASSSQLELVYNLCAELDNTDDPPHDLLADIDFGKPQEIWRTELEDKWALLTTRQKDQLLDDLELRTEVIDEMQEEAQPMLNRLFASREFLPISLQVWLENKDTYLAELVTKKTLFLFDRALEKEKGIAPASLADRIENAGILLMNEVCELTKSTQSRALCALLSYTIDIPREDEQWGELRNAWHIDDARCVPIPKECLVEENGDIIAFVRRIKFTILVKPYRDVKAEAVRIISTALRAAESEIDSFSLHDLDFLLFEKSKSEGPWEVDTLFRMVAIYQNKNARELAKKSNKIKKCLKPLRAMSALPLSTPATLLGKTKYKVIQQAEIYDEANYVNAHNLPLECGDIFECEDGSRWMLLEQPCNLMVRSHRNEEKDGERSGSVDSVVLVEIINEVRDLETEFLVELPYYHSNWKSVWINLKEQRSVALWTLDLCALNSEGKAGLSLTSRRLSNLSPAWSARQEKLRNFVQKQLAEYARNQKLLNKTKLGEADKAGLLANFIPSSGLKSPYVGVVSSDGKALTYGIKRCRRLLKPRADHALVSLHRFGSRPDTEMDFGKGK